MILPVWNVGEKNQEIDFATLFKKYDPIFAQKIIRDDGITLIQNEKKIKSYQNGLIIGFGAGDITNQLRD